ncbi:MAG: NAD(P)H-binding protein [Proteobacteria bacterium]|nr:NAD(P)H-binding protein [Pseudomonadota bacterium]MCP4920184.1 NAD(P)H-binding protein [Pseudomonadota bacterium]
MFLVTGATGLLGSRIVRLLRQARLDVRALVRPGSEYFWLNDSGCTYFFGDLRDPKSLRRAARGTRFVVHAAGIRVESTDNHHSVVTLKGTQDLIEAARERGVERFVLISAIGVERNVPNPWFDCLRQAEEHLAASEIASTVVRCAPFAEDLAESARGLARGEPWRVWASPDAIVQPLARKDAALVAMASLDLPPQTLELAGPDRMTLREAVEQACAAAGADADAVEWMTSVALMAKLARVGGRRWENWIGRQKHLYGDELVADLPKAIAVLGIPLTPYSDAIRSHLAGEPLGQDPDDRNEKVVHRQFQATVYKAGAIPYDDLPLGPLREDDA